MRRLAQPEVLKSATLAALVTALACYLRLSLWQDRSASVGFLEISIFLCGIVLWGFVFAWHTPYTGRPLWTVQWSPALFLTATLIAIIGAVISLLFIDPSLRAKAPKEFPADLAHWFAIVLFSLFMNQLFLLFAPFAWLMRLFRNQRVATALTVLFGAFILTMKARSFPAPLSMPLFTALMAGKIVTGILAVTFYLRGGILLVWWWTLIFEARYLFELGNQP